MWLTQSLFLSEELTLMCYVDDPLAALRGTAEERELFVAIMILVGDALGFQLSYKKGQLDKEFTWIGGPLRCEGL